MYALISDLSFGQSAFNAVLLIDAIEHMSKQEALDVSALAETWASKRVIINSPNGFVPQSTLDANPLQKYLSGWSFTEM